MEGCLSRQGPAFRAAAENAFLLLLLLLLLLLPPVHTGTPVLEEG